MSIYGSQKVWRVDERTHEALVAGCRNSIWLKPGGIYDKTHPEHANTPFEFFATNDPACLRDFLIEGVQPVRCGMVLRDLAFVQQVHLGDEWLVLVKHHGEGNAVRWHPFDSRSSAFAANGLVSLAKRLDCLRVVGKSHAQQHERRAKQSI